MIGRLDEATMAATDRLLALAPALVLDLAG